MSTSAEQLKTAKQLGWFIAFAVFVADQVSKWLILNLFQEATQPYYEITPFFNIVLAWNPGISFGMFGNVGDYGPTILIILSLVISVVLAVWLGKAETRLSAWAFGAIIGGALGNVIDRFRFGAVTDFLDVHVLGYHWPAFNVADSAIVVGAVLVVWESLFASPTPKEENEQSGE
ncbi:MAG: signal peptidase II [Magnetovibrio sp.]|nr:signal peptidase II [Magnetovibrio sp.]